MVSPYYFSMSSCDMNIANESIEFDVKTIMKAELKDGYLIIEDAAFNKGLLLLGYNTKYDLKLTYDLTVDGEEIEMTTLIPGASYKGVIGFNHSVDDIGNFTYQFEVHTTNIKFEESNKIN